VVPDRRAVGSSGGEDDGSHWVSDLAATARAVRGSSRLVVVGASLGSIVTFVAASASGPAGAVTPIASDTARISPVVCAAVLVSPLADLAVSGSTTISSVAVASFKRPLWLVYEAENPTIGADAAAIARRVRAQGKARVRTRGVATSDHGLELLERHPAALAFVEAAVRSCS
jgi:pimeloyl-ACP methyl ester carboxylesterase